MSTPPSPKPRRTGRFFPFAFFMLVAVFLFIGGGAALLYLIFSEYSGIKNIWLLVCGAPFALVVIVFIIIINLYLRIGQPIEHILKAINAVGEGDLSVRVKEDNSSMFNDLGKRFNQMVSDLERAEQQRRNLTADIAHELRTPLHIIQGNLEGIVDGVYEPTTEHINATLDETHLLARLVNDLQTLSLAETGQLPLHPTRFLLADLLADLTSSFSPQAEALGISLTLDNPIPDCEILGDYDRLNQVLANLVSNALRYTPRGGRISLETADSPEKSGVVRILVSDTGSGIPPDDLPFIFDRFWRGDKSRTRGPHPTSGLGLSIAKQLILAHSGRIDVESRLGEGTTFTIDLPKTTTN